MNTHERDTNSETSNRATKAEVETRVGKVREWICEDGIEGNAAIELMQELYGISRRQAIRYWVRGYRPLLSVEDRRSSDRPRDKRGRYKPWPSLSFKDV